MRRDRDKQHSIDTHCFMEMVSRRGPLQGRLTPGHVIKNKNKKKDTNNRNSIPPPKLNVTVTDSAAQSRESKFVADLDKSTGKGMTLSQDALPREEEKKSADPKP